MFFGAQRLSQTSVSARSKEPHFFRQLFRVGRKTLLVCRPEIGEYANGRADDFFQPLHLTGLRYARFKDSQRIALLHLPYRKWDSNLGIVTFGTAYQVKIRRKQLGEPFFYYGFAVAACNADDWDLKPGTMMRCQILQRGECIFDFQDVGLRQFFEVNIFAHHKLTNTLFVKFGNETMAIAVFTWQRKKQRQCRCDHRTAVEKQLRHGRVGLGFLKPFGLEDLLDIGEGVSHAAKVDRPRRFSKNLRGLRMRYFCRHGMDTKIP